jgi:hypothetical protein
MNDAKYIGMDVHTTPDLSHPDTGSVLSQQEASQYA